MLRVSILRDNVLTHGGEFATQELVDAWIEKHTGKAFGPKHEIVKYMEEVSPAVIDANGKEISPAKLEERERIFPGFTVKIEDLSLAEEALKIKKAKLLQARERFMAFDPKATTIAGLKAEVKAQFEDLKEIVRDIQ